MPNFDKDSVFGTLLVAFGVCLVCAIVVSVAAVTLQPAQQANIERDRQMNILAAAGLYDPTRPVADQFAQIQTRVVDLRTGRYSDAIDPATYNPLQAAKTPELSASFADLGTPDKAKIGRREHHALVYLVTADNGTLDKLILPIRGYGLWSTLQGFVALESDLNTIAGLGFFAHAETPGLGGEVDNPAWKASWIGKQLFAADQLAIQVIKGKVVPTNPAANHQIDGLAGATLTTRGVHNLIRFWLGDQGFAPYLQNLKTEGT
ncbi:MAG: Na(+)-translocating NADH-quinone reductase subunit C [Cellvibrionales bacterium]|nr:Na(+)-translocating NADH-quinone reductase subunit C [Cellvibrionales bacterium]